MSWPANRDDDQPRRLYLVEADAAPDALLRVLGPFAVAGAQVTAIELTEQETRHALRIEAKGLTAGGAEHLGAKLRALPIVRSVGLGWRTS